MSIAEQQLLQQQQLQIQDSEASRKVRKPYTITKSRESWTEQEHDKFLEALQLFDRDWKKIESFVGSKTVIQIRSHAQKYFLKVQKNGTGEHVPPPRPKRKAAQPYPQKAPKAAPVHPPPVLLVENSPSPSSSGSGSVCGSFTAVGQPSPSKATSPNFAAVYQFLGSVFDPNATGHLKMLGDMSQIDRETVLLLMRNLALNLASVEFMDHVTKCCLSSVPAY